MFSNIVSCADGEGRLCIEAVDERLEFELTLLDLREDRDPRLMCALVGCRNEPCFFCLVPEKLGRDVAEGGGTFDKSIEGLLELAGFACRCALGFR